MTDADLHSQLDALGAKIATARGHLEQQQKLFKEHHRLTGKQLEERYNILKDKLDGEFANEEAHGRHVSNLEKSVRAWIKDFDADT